MYKSIILGNIINNYTPQECNYFEYVEKKISIMVVYNHTRGDTQGNESRMLDTDIRMLGHDIE